MINNNKKKWVPAIMSKMKKDIKKEWKGHNVTRGDIVEGFSFIERISNGGRRESQGRISML